MAGGDNVALAKAPTNSLRTRMRTLSVTMVWGVCPTSMLADRPTSMLLNEESKTLDTDVLLADGVIEVVELALAARDLGVSLLVGVVVVVVEEASAN